MPTRRSSRWPTPRPAKWHWRTPPGSSKPSCCAIMRRLRAVRRALAVPVQFAITRPRARAIARARARACCRARRWTRCSPSARMSTAAMAPLLERPEPRRADRAGHRARAAAPGTAADRHQARAVRRIRWARRCGAIAPARARRHRAVRWLELARAPRRHRADRARRRRASPSTTKGRATACCSSRSRWPTGWSPMREWDAFIADGGYRNAALWLSDGWAWVQRERIDAPLYWRDDDGSSPIAAGWQPRSRTRRSRHISLLRGRRLRQLGRRAAADRIRMGSDRRRRRTIPRAGNQLDDGRRRPLPAGGAALFGDCWQWTRSAYLPYPRFRTAAGAVGEYNGKFMSGQFVLQGRELRHAARAFARQLPQFLLSAPALAVHRRCAWRRTSDGMPSEGLRMVERDDDGVDRRLSRRRARRPVAAPEGDPRALVLRRARLAAVRGDHRSCPNITRPAPRPRSSTARGDEFAALIGPGRAVVEFGSGSSAKTPLLLARDRPGGLCPDRHFGRFPARSRPTALAARFPACRSSGRGRFHAAGRAARERRGAAQARASSPARRSATWSARTAVDLLRSMRATLGEGCACC